MNTVSATASAANGLPIRLPETESNFLYLQNELEDTLRPSLAITDFTFIVSELIEKNIEFVKKNGMNESAKWSRERLLKLMDIGETFNYISRQNSTLKLQNRSIIIECQRLTNELSEIRKQENMANSI